MIVMKKIGYAIALAIVSSLGGAMAQNVNILPAPEQLVTGNASYTLNSGAGIYVDNKLQRNVAETFISDYRDFSGVNLEMTGKKGASIRLVTDKTMEPEAYRLKVDSDGITIVAGAENGFFYALQSLRLAAGVEHKDEIPFMEISDSPRFEYRGLMLDVSRFFMPKEDVMKVIDCMSMLKLNKLHLHLTDDNGWRLEIKKYPKLTEVGAWRVNRKQELFCDRRNPLPGEPTPIGGFYTQKDMKEIIAHAQKRCVEIIPEIDMPAHSNAALAAYPHLACPTVDKFIGVLPGLGGANADIIYCAGNEEVFSFLQGIIDEVVELFPSKYIHLGGDEAWKTHWEKCPKCQARMKEEGITHVEELQGYFMARMSKYVQSKGKTVMGWDELTNSTIPEGAIIYGWQGMGNAALKAAKQGHKFIMTPARLLYLIRYQGPQWFEPTTYFGNNTLKDIYMYEPVQSSWEEGYEDLLMGIQGSMWTEFCNSTKDVTYQIFPRLAAVADVAWTTKGKKDWASFVKSLDNYLYHLDAKGVIYSEAMYNIQHKCMAENGTLNLQLECERPDVVIRYTTDGTEPDSNSEIYNDFLTVKNKCTVKSATFVNNRKMGKTLTLDLGWNKATAKKVISKNITDKLLTNGVRGSLKQSDFEWTEWYTKDESSFVVDLEDVNTVNKVVIGCLTNYGMGVHKPSSISIDLSEDGKDYICVAERKFSKDEIFKEGNYIENITFDFEKCDKVRYIRVRATDAGMNPENHLRPGQQSRYRFDEIMVF